MTSITMGDMPSAVLERQLQVRLPADLDDALRSAADAQGLDRAAFVRWLIMRTLQPPLLEAWPVLKSKLKMRGEPKLKGAASVGLCVVNAGPAWMECGVYTRNADGSGYKGPLLEAAIDLHPFLSTAKEFAIVTRGGETWRVEAFRVFTSPGDLRELRIILTKAASASSKKGS